ncbi:MAG: glutaredoxin family protein [Candidatus Eisenbacteria bacterium]|nr:glutaredoxin family protein [Candidatus Eisenbacteria bacterium]
MSPKKPELVMYATQWCLDCTRARRFLKARGVEWREVDVDEDEEADARALAHNGGARLLPVFEFGAGRVTVAPFDKAKLAAWLIEAGAADPAKLSGAGPSAPAP